MGGHAHRPNARWGWGCPLTYQLPRPPWQLSGPGERSRARCLLTHWLARTSPSPEGDERRGRDCWAREVGQVACPWPLHPLGLCPHVGRWSDSGGGGEPRKSFSPGPPWHSTPLVKSVQASMAKAFLTNVQRCLLIYMCTTFWMFWNECQHAYFRVLAIFQISVSSNALSESVPLFSE